MLPQLAEAIEHGVGGAALAELVADLARRADMTPASVQAIATALQKEQHTRIEIDAEARRIEAEADRQELGQLLTLSYLLPGPVADALQTRARYLPTDGPSAAVPFLATIAGLVKLGTCINAVPAAGYTVPVNLYAALVGRSGAKKSPVDRLLSQKPIEQIKLDMQQANMREQRDWHEANRGVKPADRPGPPYPKRVAINEASGEALAAQLQAQESAGLGLLYYRDELSGLFGSLNQYRKGRGADEQQLLEAYDGSGLSSIRIVKSRYYSRCQLSIYGNTQPAILRELVAEGDASGLWARFLFAPLPERVVPLPIESTPAEELEAEAAADALANICSRIYRMPRRTIALSRAARAAFANYEANRQREALRATISAVSALYGKSAGKVLRIAGIVHLLAIACSEAADDAPIEAEAINRAAALVDHLDGWALSFHSEAAAGGVGGLMRAVHRTAEAVGGPVKWKAVKDRLSTAQRRTADAAACRDAMLALQRHGYGLVDKNERGILAYSASKPLP